jgi:hypothetical protein
LEKATGRLMEMRHGCDESRTGRKRKVSERPLLPKFRAIRVTRFFAKSKPPFRNIAHSL